MRTLMPALLLIIAFASVGCATAPGTAAERDELVTTSNAKLKLLQATNKDLYKLYNSSSIAVAVFPKVGKGGFIVGGAYGKGVLFENGKAVGYCDMTAGTLGAQIGGQAYTQFVFFKDKLQLTHFKNESFEFGAQVSAVAASAEAGKNAGYSNGVAVIIMDAKGLMAEASVSGQKFSYLPKDAVD